MHLLLGDGAERLITGRGRLPHLSVGIHCLSQAPGGNISVLFRCDSFSGGSHGLQRTTTSGAGLTLGGGIVIAGILIAIFWSVILGVIVALVGLLAFGGFARGRWY